jgi:hypothetical protein
MSGILNVLQHTPWWVFAVFALLTWLGAQAFLGWLARLALAHRRAAEPNLTEQVPVSTAAWRH